MTTHAELLAAGRSLASAIDVEIAAVATAVPEHVTGQQEISERAHKLYPQYARLEALYANTGIERRFTLLCSSSERRVSVPLMAVTPASSSRVKPRRSRAQPALPL